MFAYGIIFSFSVWGCYVLFSSPHSCMPPTCCLFAVWCPGWSWMTSISTCLKQRTSRPITSVQRGQVYSVTLKPSSLATRRTCVVLFLSTPTLSVEGGKLGEWRSLRVLPLKLERFCVTTTQSRGASFATQCPAWLWSAAAPSSLVILILTWKTLAALKELCLMLLTLKSVLCSCKLVLTSTGLLNQNWLIRQTWLLASLISFLVRTRVSRLF